MSHLVDVLTTAKNLHRELIDLGVSEKNLTCKVVLYEKAVTNNNLRDMTKKLFEDGHYARAVEEAYKFLDNLVEQKAELSETSASGSFLMNTAFSPKHPILKLNQGVSQSEKDEQLGYMQIFSGCMTGIRNPRAHDSEWEDTETRALQLLVLANHLTERVLLSEKV